MARHNPGDYPSANVRTAPTPSEPNTPIAEPGNNYVPGMPSPQPPLPEEPEVVRQPQQFNSNSTLPQEADHSTTIKPQEAPENSKPKEMNNHVSDTNSVDDVLENSEAVVAENSALINSTKEVIEETPPSSNDNKVDVNTNKNPNMEVETSSQKTSSPPPPTATSNSNSNSSTLPDCDSKAENNSLNEKLSKMEVNSTPSEKKGADVNNDDDEDDDSNETRFLPPEDDSVPDDLDDIPDQNDAAAVVDTDEDDDL